jgi:hypothetical protein
VQSPVSRVPSRVPSPVPEGSYPVPVPVSRPSRSRYCRGLRRKTLNRRSQRKQRQEPKPKSSSDLCSLCDLLFKSLILSSRSLNSVPVPMSRPSPDVPSQSRCPVPVPMSRPSPLAPVRRAHRCRLGRPLGRDARRPSPPRGQHSILPPAIQCAEPEFLCPCKQLWKFFAQRGCHCIRPLRTDLTFESEVHTLRQI